MQTFSRKLTLKNKSSLLLGNRANMPYALYFIGLGSSKLITIL